MVWDRESLQTVAIQKNQYSQKQWVADFHVWALNIIWLLIFHSQIENYKRYWSDQVGTLESCNTCLLPRPHHAFFGHILR